MPTQKEVREIRVVSVVEGSNDLKKLSDQFGNLNNNVKKTADTMGFFRGVFSTLLGVLGVRELIRMSDTMQQLGDRIKVITGGTGDSVEILTRLTASANRTKTSVSNLAEVYARLASSTKSAGISTDGLLVLTETLQNTFRISGATLGEASSAAIQLSQGFASGQLRGQELRAVLEANAVVGDLLEKQLGKTRGEIYKFAEAGQLTAGKVLGALIKSTQDMDGKAKQLGQTFEQTLTVAMNNLQLSVFKLNEEFGLSGKFAKGVDFLTRQMGTLSAVVITLTSIALVNLIKKMKEVSISFLTFAKGNPVITGLLVAVNLAGLLADRLGGVERVSAKGGEYIARLVAGFLRLSAAAASFAGNVKLAQERMKLAQFNDRVAEDLRKLSDPVEAKIAEIKAELQERIRNKKAIEDTIKSIDALNNKTKPEIKIKELFSQLNKEFLAGKITAEQYFDKLNKLEITKLTRSFRDGKIELEKYKRELLELQKIQITQAFNQGEISLAQFNRQVDENRIGELNIQFQKGTISLINYAEEFNKLQTKFNGGAILVSGAQGYLTSIGSTASQVATAIQNTFNGLENVFTNFIKTGKLNFKDFTQSILDDLAKIIVRASIVRPLADGLLSIGLNNFGGGLGTGDATAAATPSIGARSQFFSGNQKGSVSLASKGTSVLPLSVASAGGPVAGGDALVNFNIVNNSNAEIETKESTGPSGERTIEVMIQNKVKEGFASGAFDKSLRTSYGISRKGS